MKEEDDDVLYLHAHARACVCVCQCICVLGVCIMFFCAWRAWYLHMYLFVCVGVKGGESEREGRDGGEEEEKKQRKE